MPELPETETIARDLDRAISGDTILDVRVTRKDVLRETTPARLRDRVVGASVTRTWRRAKLIVIDLSSGDRVVVQPRFTGALLIDAGHLAEDERRYSTVEFILDSSRSLHYRDIRRLGTVALMDERRFAEYSGFSLLPLARELDNVLIIRSFESWSRLPELTCAWGRGLAAAG